MTDTRNQCPSWCTRAPENHAAVLDGEELIEHETLIGFAPTADAEISVTLTAVDVVGGAAEGSHAPTVFATLKNGHEAGSWGDAGSLRAYALLLLEASQQLDAARHVADADG